MNSLSLPPPKLPLAKKVLYSSAALIITGIALSALSALSPYLLFVGTTLAASSFISFFISLTIILKKETSEDTKKLYNKLNEQILIFTKKTEDLDEKTLASSYNAFREFLSKHLPYDFPSHQAQKIQVARFTQSWRRVNDAFEKHLQQGPIHLTCGCHIAKEGSTLPLMNNHLIDGVVRYTKPENDAYEPRYKKTLLLFTTKAGGGNVTVSKGIIEALKHSHHIDIAPTHSAFEESFYNDFLIRGEHWVLLKFLMRLFQHTDDSITFKFSSQVIDQIDLSNPDLLMTVSPHITRALYIEGCLKRKLPLFTIATDFDGQDFVHFLPKYPDLVYMGIPHGAQSIRDSLQGKISEENIQVVGYPVPAAFKEKCDPLEIRHNMNKFLNLDLIIYGNLSVLDDTAPITAIMMGSLGSGKAIENYTDAFLKTGKTSPLFVCCGSNQLLYKKLYRKYKNYPYIRILPRLSANAVAKLYSILKILFTKPGGATIVEAITKNVPLLIDDTSKEKNEALYWEGSNVRFIEQQDLGKILRDPKDFGSLLENMLTEDRKFSFSLEDFKSKIMELLALHKDS